MTRVRAGREGRPVPSSPRTMLRAVSWAASSRPGRGAANQDRFGMDGYLFSIADGMGGLQDGDLAAAEAVASLHSAAPRDAEGLQAAVFAANTAVRALASRTRRDLGTTLAAVLVAGDDLRIVSVGDSRAHFGADGSPVETVTSDDTVAVVNGITPGNPAYEVAASGLTNYLGAEPILDRRTLALRTPALRARAVLTTDGVHRAISSSMLAWLAGGREP